MVVFVLSSKDFSATLILFYISTNIYDSYCDYEFTFILLNYFINLFKVVNLIIFVKTELIPAYLLVNLNSFLSIIVYMMSNFCFINIFGINFEAFRSFSTIAV